MNKWFYASAAAVCLAAAGCNATYMPAADPNRSDLVPAQAQQINAKKIHVPCRIEVHCADSMVGQRDSFFYTDYYHYPLQQILTNSFKNAAYQVFDPPGGEVIDAFNLYVTVPESNLDVAWGKANYILHVIVRFDEPGEKKVIATSIAKHVQLPFPNHNQVPDAVYQACRDAAFEAMQRIIKDPKVHKTVRRFESR